MRTRNTHHEGEDHDRGRRTGSAEFEIRSDCERVAPILHRYVEGELDPIRSHMVERHIASCAACLSEKEGLDLERLWLVEMALEGPILSTRLVDKVMEPVRREVTARSRSRRWRRVAVSAAACLLAVVVGYSSGAWFPAADTPVSIAGNDPASPPGAGSSEAGEAVRVPDHKGHLSPGERRRLDGSARPSVHLALDDDGRPVERGGFRVGQTNPMFVDFVPPGVSSLPSREDLADHHEEPSCEGSLPAGDIDLTAGSAGRVRIFRVKVISRHARTTFQVRFRDTLGIALHLRSSAGRNDDGGASRPAIDLDPCLPDPNSDGRTDSGDIAYGLQVLYGAQTPDDYGATPDAPEPECESSCLRA